MGRGRPEGLVHSHRRKWPRVGAKAPGRAEADWAGLPAGDQRLGRSHRGRPRRVRRLNGHEQPGRAAELAEARFALRRDGRRGARVWCSPRSRSQLSEADEFNGRLALLSVFDPSGVRIGRAHSGYSRPVCRTGAAAPENGIRPCDTGRMSVIFLSGPIGAGKTAVAQELLPLLPGPLSYIEGDTFWSFIRKEGESGQPDTFPVLVRSMTAAALPLARSGFRVLIDFSIPPTFVVTARKILKEVPFDFVLLRPSLEVCVERAASREKGAITDHARMKNFYTLFEQGTVEPICDDSADPASLAQRIAEGLNQGRFRMV
jgi:hypothetical protein